MRTDPESLLGSAVLIFVGVAIFLAGAEGALPGPLTARALVNNVAEAMGYFAGFWLMAFVFMFTAAMLFVSRPSRVRARQTLVVSAALVALVIVGMACVSLFERLHEMPSRMSFFALFGGVWLAGAGVHLAFRANDRASERPTL
jgi:hypothetical protein